MPMVFSMSNAGSIFHSPMPKATHSTANTVTMVLECLKVKTFRRSIRRLRRVPPEPSIPRLGCLSLPNESSTGAISRVVNKTKNTVSELVMPTHFIGLIGITINDIREITVVKPQNTTDQPISLTVSTTAVLRLPCVRMSWLK